MSVIPRRHARALGTLATLTLSASLVLLVAVMPAQASLPGGSKTCVHITGCSASASSPPRAFAGGPPPTPSHLTVAVATAPKSAANARHASGRLITAAHGGRRIRCGGYRLKAPTTFQFQLQATASASSASSAFRVNLDITYELTEKITNTTADGVEFCLAADFGFRTLSGRPARVGRLPDSTQGHIGLLPPCPQPLPPAALTTAPCLEPVATVTDEHSTTGVDVVLKARVPTLVGVATVRGSGDSRGGDPWGGG